MRAPNKAEPVEGKNSAHHKVNSPWPKELRVTVARAVADQGLSTFAVARKLDVPYTTAVTWVKSYRQRGAEALEPKRAAASEPE